MLAVLLGSYHQNNRIFSAYPKKRLAMVGTPYHNVCPANFLILLNAIYLVGKSGVRKSEREESAVFGLSDFRSLGLSLQTSYFFPLNSRIARNIH